MTNLLIFIFIIFWINTIYIYNRHILTIKFNILFKNFKKIINKNKINYKNTKKNAKK